MRKQYVNIVLLAIALVALVIGFLLSSRPADAHMQVYPHVHPHAHVAISEDALMAGTWALLVIAQLGLAWWLGRRSRRARRKVDK